MLQTTSFGVLAGRRMPRWWESPCDVLHLDTGWFAKDWVCEREFSEERFPDAEGFMREMRIDFSNPEAVRWYQGLLERLLRMGTAQMDMAKVVSLSFDDYIAVCHTRCWGP